MSTGAGEVRLQKLTRPVISGYAERDATVIVPIGAVEQHGDHLPVETDIYNAETVAVGAAEGFDDVLVAPPIPWGLSHAHVGLGGTVSITPSTFLALAMDITETLLRSGFERLIWVNGHHGNKPIMALIVYESKRLHGLSVGAVTYYDLAVEAFAQARRSGLGGSGHACEFETSLMLHLRPEAVSREPATRRPIVPRSADDFADLAAPGATAVGYTFPERFPEGVMGDPTVSAAETGRSIYEAALNGMVEFVRAFRDLPPRGAEAPDGD